MTNAKHDGIAMNYDALGLTMSQALRTADSDLQYEGKLIVLKPTQRVFTRSLSEVYDVFKEKRATYEMIQRG